MKYKVISLFLRSMRGEVMISCVLMMGLKRKVPEGIIRDIMCVTGNQGSVGFLCKHISIFKLGF
jgi:hypothetical protein